MNVVLLLFKFFEGLTSDEENRQIKAWVELSPENKKRFFEERKLFDAIVLNRSVPKRQISTGLEKKPDKLRHIVFVREAMRLAAVIFIVLAGSWCFYIYHNTDDVQPLMQTINVPAGQRLNLTLPDGTNVWVNANSTIRYPINFNKTERMVCVDGQAYFEVAQNKKVPFIVKSPQVMIQVIGTKFDVCDYSREEGNFHATLMEGSMKVFLKNEKQKQVMLEPEDKAHINSGKLIVTRVTDFSQYQWKEGLISFKNESFGEIIRIFERIYDMQIVMDNTATADIVYTGKFRMTDGIDYALRVLQQTVDFSFERDIDKQIIYIR